MTTDEMIDIGNQNRADRKYVEALGCYAQVFASDPNHFSAWNNYGNVMRECGEPARAIPFLEHAAILDPNNVTAKFNLAISRLAMGDWARGWKEYEVRWNYEHLAGTKPQLGYPEWQGEDLKDKSILVVSEQGHGDAIQFIRFVDNLKQAGAKIHLHCVDTMRTLFNSSSMFESVVCNGDPLPQCDYWICLMSIPSRIGLELDHLKKNLQYIKPDTAIVKKWADLLGPKKKMRIGIAWAGRRDSWIHNHKSMPVEILADFVKAHPEYQWISLQVDASEEETAVITAAGVDQFPGAIQSWSDTTGLVQNLDLVISVDTAVAHLSGAMGRPTWVPLNLFGACWRWLTKRDDSPWYPSMRLFRQKEFDNWDGVIKDMKKFLGFFKV